MEMWIDTMVLTPEVEICAFIGAFIGIMIVSLKKYYNKKKELGEDDVTIFFDRKFVKSAVVAGILSAVAVGGSFPMILDNVNPGWSYLTTVIMSAGLAITLNIGGNILVGPSAITAKEEDKALENKITKILSTHLDTTIMKLRKSDTTESEIHRECNCRKCKKDDEEVIP
jgi:hypothetical protein